MLYGYYILCGLQNIEKQRWLKQEKDESSLIRLLAFNATSTLDGEAKRTYFVELITFIELMLL